MNCPRCAQAMLEEREREGITIDVCPSCRGIWLDRGELERFMAYAAREFDGPPSSRPHAPHPARWDQHGDYSQHRPERRYRKKGFLESLGDIFD